MFKRLNSVSYPMACLVAAVLFFATPVKNAQAGDTDDASRTMTFNPYVDVSTGYDSNLDGLVSNPTASGFVKVEAGFSWKTYVGPQLFSSFGKIRNFDYNNLDVNNRYDLEAALGWRLKIDDNQTLKAGASFYRDHIALSKADLFDSFIDYRISKEQYSLRLKGKIHTELNTSADGAIGSETIDVFNISRNQAFDYHRPEATLNLLMLKQLPVQPFFIGGIYHANYFHEVAAPVLTREARGYYTIGGARIKLGNDFRVDLGMRYNRRFTQDKLVTHGMSNYFDGRLRWLPFENLKITAGVERKFSETTALFGVFDDVKIYTLGADWSLRDNVLLHLSGKKEVKDPFGDDLLYTIYTLKATASYRPKEQLEIYGEFLGKFVDEEFFNENYERYTIEVGVRMNF